MNSQDLDERIKEQMPLPTEDLQKILDISTAKDKALKDNCDQFVKRNFSLTEKSRELDDELSEIKINRLKIEGQIKVLKQNELEIIKLTEKCEEDTIKNQTQFEDLNMKTKMVYALYKNRRAEIAEFKKEMDKQINQAKLKNREASNELNLKEESLEATKQVLESKLACVQHDRDERVKKEHILEEFKKCNYENKLKELFSQREVMNKEFMELNMKQESMTHALIDLDNQNKTLNDDAEVLALELTEILNDITELQKATELKQEFFMKSFTEKASIEAQKIHEDNLELAKSLRDDLIQSDQLAGEIQKLTVNFKNSENICQDLVIQISDKKAMLKKIDDEIDQKNQIKEKVLQSVNKYSETFEKKKKGIDEYRKKVDEIKATIKKNEKKTKAVKRGKLSKKLDIMEISSDSSFNGDSSFNFTMSSISGDLPDIDDVLAKILSEKSSSTNENN